MGEAKFRKVILDNLSKLADLTTLSTRALDKLMERNIITRPDWELLKSVQNGSYERNSKFYMEILYTKDADSYQLFYKLMQEDSMGQSRDVLDILKTGIGSIAIRPPVHANEILNGDFSSTPVLEEHNNFISTALSKDTDVVLRKNEFFGALGLQNYELIQLQDDLALKRNVNYDFINRTISKWIARNGKAKATVGNLIESTRSAGFVSAADTLREAYTEHLNLNIQR